MPGILDLLHKKQGSKAGGVDYGVLVLGPDGGTMKYKVVEVAGYKDGYAMRYLDGDKTLEVVYVPRDYHFVEDHGVMMVGKRFGNNSACPIMFLGESVDQDCPGADLSEVGRSDLFARGIKTLSGKQNVNWKVILIIGGIAVVAIFLLYKFKGGG